VLDLNQCSPLRFGLDHASRLAVHEQQVVNPTVPLLKDELSNRYAWASRDVGLIGALDDPTGGSQLLVDVLACASLSGEVGV
jgi:hypothetical protein